MAKEKFIMRGFKMTHDVALRLSNTGTKTRSAGDYVRDVLSQHLSTLRATDVRPFAPGDVIVLRTYYLTSSIDAELTAVARKLKITKGEAFRACIGQGFGPVR